MPRGASPKRERRDEHIKESAPGRGEGSRSKMNKNQLARALGW